MNGAQLKTAALLLTGVLGLTACAGPKRVDAAAHALGYSQVRCKSLGIGTESCSIDDKTSFKSFARRIQSRIGNQNGWDAYRYTTDTGLTVTALYRLWNGVCYTYSYWSNDVELSSIDNSSCAPNSYPDAVKVN